MIQNIVEIKISGLPGIFPIADYQGKINTYLRVIAMGNYSEKVITEKSFRTIYDANYQERMVQVTVYNKYKIRVMTNEYLRADLIEFAKYGYVTTQDGVTHKMKVLNVSYIKVDGMEIGTYEIEYADINPKNYKNQTLPINNYLESNEIQNEFATAQLILLTIDDSGTTPFTSTIDAEFMQVVNTAIGATPKNKFYSELLPEYVIPEIKKESEAINGVEKVTASIGSRALAARFYLNTENKNVIAKYLQRCDTVTLDTPSGTYTALERMVPEVQPVGINLFQVDIVFKYEVLNYYPENI